MRPHRQRVLSLCAVALLAAACTASPAPTQRVPSPTGPRTSPTPIEPTQFGHPDARGRPNVLVILSDDQATALFNRELMPNLFGKVIDRGVNFRRAYVNLSQCCPSRASILTGLYSHNTGVDANNIKLDTQRPVRPTFVQALHEAGYRTMLAGKYLNSESCDPHPGWTRWVCATREDQTDPLLNIDGLERRMHGFTVDIIARYAIDFIDENRDPNHPFFVYLAPRSPHLPGSDTRAESLPVPLYRPPSYDAQPDPGALPEWVRTQHPMSLKKVQTIRDEYVTMVRQVPPMDAAIGKVLDSLEDRAHDTLVIFLSDNGYMYGEHRVKGKNQPYEESVRVPMAIRFPKLLPPSRSFTSAALVENVDVPSTIMDVAGIPWSADGISLLPLLRRTSDSVRDGLLIEWCKAKETPCPGGAANPPPFYGVVTERYVYVSYESGERELYDLQEDPYELTNLAGTDEVKSIERRLADSLDALSAATNVPATTIVTGAVSRGGTATFSFFSQSRTTRFWCRLEGPGQSAGWAACDEGTASYDDLARGSYRFEVQAVDDAGRLDPSPAGRRFRVR